AAPGSDEHRLFSRSARTAGPGPLAQVVRARLERRLEVRVLRGVRSESVPCSFFPRAASDSGVRARGSQAGRRFRIVLNVLPCTHLRKILYLTIKPYEREYEIIGKRESSPSTPL
ncbi:hypothetical protein MRX96_036898, partial [Rhipicephalus microplus]